MVEYLTLGYHNVTNSPFLKANTYVVVKAGSTCSGGGCPAFAPSLRCDSGSASSSSSLTSLSGKMPTCSNEDSPVPISEIESSIFSRGDSKILSEAAEAEAIHLKATVAPQTQAANQVDETNRGVSPGENVSLQQKEEESEEGQGQKKELEGEMEVERENDSCEEEIQDVESSEKMGGQAIPPIFKQQKDDTQREVGDLEEEKERIDPTDRDENVLKTDSRTTRVLSSIYWAIFVCTLGFCALGLEIYSSVFRPTSEVKGTEVLPLSYVTHLYSPNAHMADSADTLGSLPVAYALFNLPVVVVTFIGVSFSLITHLVQAVKAMARFCCRNCKPCATLPVVLSLMACVFMMGFVFIQDTVSFAFTGQEFCRKTSDGYMRHYGTAQEIDPEGTTLNQSSMPHWVRDDPDWTVRLSVTEPCKGRPWRANLALQMDQRAECDSFMGLKGAADKEDEEAVLRRCSAEEVC
uniref:Transmembrane protein n=1 Tax=Chromera velia CCMP2878 TaxID=1169474 RepID=A0A0G4GMU5_9ALVE|eukprot:Cvel_22575.t1-p1 / transcript=Cvel_22575.t1 / gene=Cvel_22575 / organism=Chromera_velia_CCMP2878 / gene_product=hypothetical protein / transcript_product=hypothetical protein / location=Cvel_scaffold2231:21127-23832(+) / protein_length=464 / sequence_SO=supercontig / SO=protein_coding / is_pseudo=false